MLVYIKKTKVGSINRLGCFTSKCDEFNKIIITANSSDHTCNFTGEELTIGSITIICPDASDFCPKFNAGCSTDCNGRGRCTIGNTCYCDYFYVKDFQTNLNQFSNDYFL